MTGVSGLDDELDPMVRCSPRSTSQAGADRMKGQIVDSIADRHEAHFQFRQARAAGERSSWLVSCRCGWTGRPVESLTAAGDQHLEHVDPIYHAADPTQVRAR